YDPRYGARPLRRVIQKYIEDEIAEGFLRQEYPEGCEVFITLEEGKISFRGIKH
ncbi:MAG: hypothetical protein GX962_03775, partial [Epulopiscium sp.]|nr:hypothetical protein [Candidatus Epulonipiscium sp.]